VLGFDESRGAFVWDGNRTEAKLLSALPGGNGSQGLAINNAGVVAGWSDTTGGADHATVWSGSTVKDLGVLHGGRESQALAINDAELMAGWSDTRSIGGPSHATLWEGSRMIDLGFLPGGNASKALGINDAGMAVGWSSSFPEGQRAVLWNGATAIDLNSFLDADKASAGWHLTSANDINERGWIVGDAHNNLTGEDHAFLLVPAANLSTGFWLVNFSNDSGYPEWRDWNGSELHFLTEFPGGDNRLLSGYIEWTSNNGDFGRENFEGTLDANNHLALNGMAIVQPASKDVDIGWYEADLGSGTLLNGSWARRDDNGSLTLGNWAAVQVVPEPQTYIMLLAGLGLVGFMMRGQKADIGLLSVKPSIFCPASQTRANRAAAGVPCD
jgi:probable HAF family extracellular repeat protein